MGLAPGLQFDALEMALYGGEDYELLFTVPAPRKKSLQKAPGFPQWTEIGSITRGKQILLLSPGGRSKPLEPRGWDPFRER